MSTRSLGRGGAVARGWGPPVFHHQHRFVTVSTHGDTLLMVVKEGPQVHVMGFEIYALAIVNELYFRRLAQGTAHDAAFTEGRARLQAKIALLRDYQELAQPVATHLSFLISVCAGGSQSLGKKR